MTIGWASQPSHRVGASVTHMRFLQIGCAAMAMLGAGLLTGCGDQLPTNAQIGRRVDVAALDILMPTACKEGNTADIKQIARRAVRAAALDPSDVIHTPDGDVTLKDALMHAFATGCQAEKDALSAAIDEMAAKTR